MRIDPRFQPGKSDGRLTGQTIVICASGPSLAVDDIELVRKSGLHTIAVNRTVELVSWCAVWYFGDDRFAREYYDKLKTFAEGAEIWTCSENAARRHGIKYHEIHGPYNSGLRACQFALREGVVKAILLGFDCQHSRGRRHWHEDYSGHFGNATSCDRWIPQFNKFATQIRGKMEVVNCSRSTALICFPRMDLENALKCAI